INSVDEGVDALGYVVENARLGQTLNTALLSSSSLDIFSPAVVTEVRAAQAGMQMQLQSAGTTTAISASLVVLAEGGRSGLCAALGIAHRHVAYEQSALIANVALSQPHEHIAYE